MRLHWITLQGIEDNEAAYRAASKYLFALRQKISLMMSCAFDAQKGR